MNINVNWREDNKVKINFCTAKMSATVDKLRDLDGATFQKLIRAARIHRKALDLINSHYEEAGATMKLSVANREAMVVNDLVLLGKDEFKRVIKVARKMRRADRTMELADKAYAQLKTDDGIFRKVAA